ncbi:MAG: hypothetical protein GC160_18730 [Acidobacteria bacterium]|nr:hypothetical protein [Acidobacteriota bacterium]
MRVNKWKLWIFAIVMSVTLVLLWKAITNINSAAEYQIDEAELRTLVAEGSLVGASIYLDQGLLEGRLSNGDFIWVEGIGRPSDMGAWLQEQGVTVDTLESKNSQFWHNTVPFAPIVLLQIYLLVKFRKRILS